MFIAQEKIKLKNKKVHPPIMNILNSPLLVDASFNPNHQKLIPSPHYKLMPIPLFF